jgi:hypothetical protein
MAQQRRRRLPVGGGEYSTHNKVRRTPHILMPFMAVMMVVVANNNILSSTVVVFAFSTIGLVPTTRTWIESPSQQHSFSCSRHRTSFTAGAAAAAISTRTNLALFSNRFPSDEEKDDNNDEEDDEYITTDSLGDWRNFRRNLSLQLENDHDDDVDDDDADGDFKDSEDNSNSTRQSNSRKKSLSVQSVSKDNEEVLRSQNKNLAEEYLNGVWAHQTSTVRYRCW